MTKDKALAIKEKGELVYAIDQHGVDQILKPFTKKIYLFDTYIANTTHIEDPSVFEDIQPGDSLILQREVNRYDEMAILIMTNNKKKLGYIPEKDNVIFSRLMDAGKMLTADIDSIERKGSFIQIQIKIYLIDF